MTTQQLKLRSATQLADERFYVPAYQRGYRWTRQQVTELLDDVWEFVQSGGRSRGQFYCLQPVVVAPRSSGDWELVDGQQRLTTLYLILRRCNERLQEADRHSLFTLEYQTRPTSTEFLRELDLARSQENVDFHHMAEAYAAINEWLKDRKSHFNDVESAFLNDVKVIWYEVTDVNPVEVFQRLNIGKISLTSAELVKALLLRASNFEEDDKQKALQLQQLQIAHEWDAIEGRLGEDAFWYFLTNERKESNRIEFILQLYVESLPTDDAAWSGGNVFHAFVEHLSKPNVHAWTVWEDVKGLFQTVESWFRDNQLYHRIGFLTAVERDGEPHRAISRVHRLALEAQSKRGFRDALRAEIFTRVFRIDREDAPTHGAPLREFIADQVDDFDYLVDARTGRIQRILLLFNLASLSPSKSDARFPFAAYKLENWDIEHIRSVHSRMPLNAYLQKRWLEGVIEYLGSSDAKPDSGPVRAKEETRLVEEARRLHAAEPFDTNAFAEFFSAVQRVYHPQQYVEVDNSLGNLTLLDERTNRSYGNAIFPIKRKTVIARDRIGDFVPLCTRNVFLKYYSTRVDRMLDWTRDDVVAYTGAIVDTLTRFFEQEAVA